MSICFDYHLDLLYFGNILFFFGIYHELIIHGSGVLGPHVTAKWCLRRWVYNMALQGDPAVRAVFSGKNVVDISLLFSSEQ